MRKLNRVVALRRAVFQPLLLILWSCCAAIDAWALPAGFVYLDQAAPEIASTARYAGKDNFVGAPVDGYRVPRVVLSAPAAAALRQAAAALAPFGLGLKVFDGYRPRLCKNVNFCSAIRSML